MKIHSDQRPALDTLPRRAHPLRRASLLAAGLTALALPLAACGTAQISQSELQTQIQNQWAQQYTKPDSVSCPSALDAKVGATERCILSFTSAGKKLGVTVTVKTVTGDQANFDIQADKTFTDGSTN